MKKAIFLTAYDRPSYFNTTLASWAQVRGASDWDLVLRFEPSQYTAMQVRQAKLSLAHSDFRSITIIENPERYGVLHHPWRGFDALFEEGYDFVARTEDDLIVSDDVLELLSWQAENLADLPDVATAHACNLGKELDEDVVYLFRDFNPLVWGTWRDRWYEFIRDTWDHDYSTFNGVPGVHSGWDWNLNTRILPARGAVSAFPGTSRVHNIGIVGTHSTPENYHTAETFRPDYLPTDFRLAAEKADIT